MNQRYRTPEGGAIDRGAPLAFSFNGRTYTGYRGDTLASALLANGVHLVARSFKYHRPRGIVSAGPEEPCALVRVGEGARVRPNVPATLVELYDGLTAGSLNCWPGVAFDVGAMVSAVAAWLPAGFYYKTFMWPRRAWMHYERFIRRAAGLGVVPDTGDPDRYDKRFEHCDVLVVGAGPAGLAAALAAGEAGARVVLADERPTPGGQLHYRDERIEGVEPRVWLGAVTDRLARLTEVRLLTRTTALGYYDHNLVTLLERVADHLPLPGPNVPRQRLWKIFAQEVVIATGALERPLVFERNDLPGVMLAGAAQCYARQYGVRAGSRAVVFTNNDSGYEAARALLGAGVAVAAVVDSRDSPPGVRDLQGIELLRGHVVVRAQGRRRVSGVIVRRIDGGTGARTVACDLICVSGGWDPAVHLYSQSGGRLTYDEVQQCFVPGTPVQPTHAAGAANGAFGLVECLAQGRAAGLAAAHACGFAVSETRAPPPRRTQAVHALGSIDERAPMQFVDLQHDVTVGDLGLAAREGYVSVEHAKRYTTTGMGVDQGKAGNVLAYGVLGQFTARAVPGVGTTTFRPPYTPATIGALAGREIGARLDPIRRTPTTSWHQAAGAVFEPVGLWRRPLYYPRAGEDMDAAVARECAAARAGAVLLDASTLGKIELYGRDASELLNRVYTNRWDDLALGRCRYGLMLTEDGMVFDDGVTTRLGAQHYLMSTTSGGADRVHAWLEEWLQCEWRDLEVYLTPVTAQWANVCVSGPNARAVLTRLASDIDFSAAAFPHMSVRKGTIAGMRARVARVSFTGEVSYEINVAARHGLALWEALCEVGARDGLTPLGTEALHVLRAEKGYIAVGRETDGTVNPLDLGLARLVDMNKGDFLGKRGLLRSDNRRPDRKQLVGLLTEDAWTVVREGSQIVTDERARRLDQAPVPMIGHVTSGYMSPKLGRSIALALVSNGRRRMGERVRVVVRGRPVVARVCAPMFYDAEGERLRG
jgi:sarcosine oxidase, subunit alpha